MHSIKSLLRLLTTLPLIFIVSTANAQTTTITGADPTGVNDSSTAFNNATANINNLSTLIIPPGTYRMNAQWNVSGQITHNVKISGYGVELITTGPISAMKISVNGTPHQLTIEGITVNHRGNATATAGFELQASAHVHLVDCTVEAHGVNNTYAGIWLHNSNPNNADTGNFWTVIDRFAIRKRSGTDIGDIRDGIKLQGAANATTIQNSSFANVYSGVNIIAEPTATTDKTYISNGVLIQGNWFEGFSEAIKVTSVNNTLAARWISASGLRIVNNRAENSWANDTTFFRLAGTGGNEIDPPVLAFNYLLGVRNLFENDASRKIILLDAQNFAAQTTPSVPVQTATLFPGR